MISDSMNHVLTGVRHGLHHEGVRAADRLLIAYEDLARWRTRTMSVGVGATPSTAPISLGQAPGKPRPEKSISVLRFSVLMLLIGAVGSRCRTRRYPGYSPAGSPGGRRSGRRQPRPAPSAVVAVAAIVRPLARRPPPPRPRRCRAALRSTQPSMLRCGARATPSAPGGTSSVMTLPAAV